jgi:hypothetical protein
MTLKVLEEKPSSIHRNLKQEKVRNVFIKGIREGNWSTSPVQRNAELIDRLGPVAQTLPVRSVDTDAGVTQDLSKLIRVPNSIHGDTGLIAKVFDEAELEKFEPLRDALAQPSHVLDEQAAILAELLGAERVVHQRVRQGGHPAHDHLFGVVVALAAGLGVYRNRRSGPGQAPLLGYHLSHGHAARQGDGRHSREYQDGGDGKCESARA